jgi:hypothetical protein
MFHQNFSSSTVTNSYPIGVLQNLPTIFWITVVAYAIITPIIALSQRLSRTNQILLFSLAISIMFLRVLSPSLLTNHLYGEDSFMHHANAQTIINEGTIDGMFDYKGWPSSFILAALVQDFCNISPLFATISMSVLMFGSITLTCYLIVRKIFGSRVGRVFLVIYCNLTLPLNASQVIYYSPYTFAILLGLLVIYAKFSTLTKGSSIGYGIMAVILAFAAVTAHLLTPLFLGLFLVSGFLLSVIVSRALRNPMSLAVTALSVVIISTTVFLHQRVFPAFLSTFFVLGVSIGFIFCRVKQLSILGTFTKKLTSAYFAVPFTTIIVGLSLFQRFIPLLLAAAYTGFYLGRKLVKIRVFELKHLNLRSIPPLGFLGVLLVTSTLFWWMSREPSLFRVFSRFLKAAVEQLRVESFYVGSSLTLKTQPFEIFQFYNRILWGLLIISTLVGFYLFIRKRTSRTVRLLTVSCCAIILMTFSWSELLAGWGSRLDPLAIFFGLAVLSFVLVTLPKLGLKKLSIIFLTVTIFLMSASPINVYNPQMQTQLFFEQDIRLSSFVEQSFEFTEENFEIVGDQRPFLVTLFYVSNISWEDWGSLVDFFERSIWFQGTERENSYDFDQVDYILLVKSTPERLLYRQIEPEEYRLKLEKMRMDKNISRIYDNGYDEINAVTTKPD